MQFKPIRHDSGQIQAIETKNHGTALLDCKYLNKDTAFSASERQAFHLQGLLPDRIETLEDQAKRSMEQYATKTTALGKNIFLNHIHDRNTTLFFNLIQNHLDDLLPIIYTPTIGDAVINFSHQFRRTRGIYLSYRHAESMMQILQTQKHKPIDVVVVTDGEGVLGIGDWGVGGMDICLGKSMVYTACSGLCPWNILPVQIDVGTNNEKLLQDPMYLGWQQPRITGESYDGFIDQVIQAIQNTFPNAMIHWEDFGPTNAHQIFERYRHQHCSFNDDIQGTALVVLSCILTTQIITKQDWFNQRIIMYGAGTAGMGIVNQIYQAMLHAGLSPTQAQDRIWLVDQPGLLTTETPIRDLQKPFMKSRDHWGSWSLANPNHITLYDTIAHIQPTVLIGCSAQAQAFDQQCIQLMAKHCQRPLILPLSNPTSRSEAHPNDIKNWTENRALIATGSPYPPITEHGKCYHFAQANNAYIFPGLGLGAAAAKPSIISQGMLTAACQTLSEHTPIRSDSTAQLLPPLNSLISISQKIAFSVAQKAYEEGVSHKAPDMMHIKEKTWDPQYVPLQPME
jgi:malate dehydrogenase (oxaloacetate-decarboxylating)